MKNSLTFAQELRRLYDAGLPLVSGGDPSADEPIFPALPENYLDLTDEALAAFEAEVAETLEHVTTSPAEFVTADIDVTALLAASQAALADLQAVRAELASRAETPEPVEIDDATAAAFAEVQTAAFEVEGAEGTDPAEAPASEAPAADEPPVETPVEEPAAPAADEPPVEEDPEVPVEDEPTEFAADPVEAPEAPAAVVAAAPAPSRLAAPARSRRSTPAPAADRPRVSLVASASGLGADLGSEISEREIANMMIARRRQFGEIPPGTSGEKYSIARANWSSLYPDDRVLTGRDEFGIEQAIADVMNPSSVKAALRERRAKSLVASGGLCAPVTPYYELAMISTTGRPVRAALPAFSADRGGIKYARPASLASIDTAVGIKTAAEDGAGGSDAVKTCQVIACPDWVETDVEMIYHCIQWGNLPARTFPERLVQMNQLTLAAQSRLADSQLLTHIDAFSTQVHAGSLGCATDECSSAAQSHNLGVSALLFGQILAAANGMRNRHRMDPEAVLRLMIPDWTIDLLISDVIRGQFQRFDTDEARVVALLRSFDIEPTFYIDGPAGKGQVFGDQIEGALLPFPDQVVWYLYPEGSFIFLDGGSLELGLVRDSVLNKTNDYQIFGETFENVAFVGVESLAVTSDVADTGAVGAPTPVGNPVDYSDPRALV